MLLLDSQIILGPVVVISSPKDFSRECFLDRTVGSHDSPVETVSSHVSELLLRASFKTPDAKKTWFRFGQLIWFEETSWDSPQVSSTSNSSDSGEISLVTACSFESTIVLLVQRFQLQSRTEIDRWRVLERDEWHLVGDQTRFLLESTLPLLLMRSNITNPKTEYYIHYRGSVYCTEQEFGTFYMRSS